MTTKPPRHHHGTSISSHAAAARSWVVGLSLVVAYLGLNLSLNALNKWMLTSFSFAFPLILCASHAAFNFLALLPFMLWRHTPGELVDTMQRQFLGLCAVGIFFSAGMGLNNLSLVTVPLRCARGRGVGAWRR